MYLFYILQQQTLKNFWWFGYFASMKYFWNFFLHDDIFDPEEVYKNSTFSLNLIACLSPPQCARISKKGQKFVCNG